MLVIYWLRSSRFRWAACQIDMLGRLHNVCDIRKALHELPETLDETYERILMKIPQKSSKFAHKVLQLLAFCTADRCGFDKLNALAEAVIVDVEQLSFSPEKRLLDRNALFEICTCLITVISEDKVILAHYSVKEYLDSERIKLGPATSFQISKIASEVLGTTICLVYFLDITYEGVCSDDDYDEMTEDQQKDYHCYEDGKFPLLATALSWLQVLRYKDIWTIQGPNTAIIHNLLIRLFNSKGVHYKKWLDRLGFNSEDGPFEDGPHLTHWKTQPGAEPNTAFAIACGYGLVETTKVILESNPNLSTSGDLVEVEYDGWISAFNLDETHDKYLQAGTLLDLLDVAIYFHEPEFVELLLDSGANPNAISPDGCCKLLLTLKVLAFGYIYHVDNFRLGAIESLLKADADPNPRGVAITPLQAACLCEYSNNVELLLDAGAQVNAVGDDRAIIAGIQRRSTTEADQFIMGDGWPLKVLSQIEIRKLISTRGALRNYETPLRIVEKQLHQSAGDKRDELLEMKNLLIEKGGKSLNLYPGHNIPGHLEAYDYHTSISKARISYVIN